MNKIKNIFCTLLMIIRSAYHKQFKTKCIKIIGKTGKGESRKIKSNDNILVIDDISKKLRIE